MVCDQPCPFVRRIGRSVTHAISSAQPPNRADFARKDDFGSLSAFQPASYACICAALYVFCRGHWIPAEEKLDSSAYPGKGSRQARSRLTFLLCL